MASSGYLGPNEVQALIGQWVDLVSGDDDKRWWRKPPPWWRQSKKDWERLPEWQQRQRWQSAPQQGGQPGYPQQPYGQQPAQWWLQQPAWWRQQNPWYPQMPWQAQQPQYPYQQPPYQQPPSYQPQPAPRPGYRWVPPYGSTPGRWERESAYQQQPYQQPYQQQPYQQPYQSPSGTVRDHRGGAGTYGGTSVSVTPGSQRAITSEGGWPFGLGTGTVRSGQWYDLAGPMVGQLPPPDGFPFPPRGAVVAAPMPTQANRDILPMSTGVPILPTQSAQITGRPQVLVFKIGRFVISNAGTAGGAADWIVNDIKIGNRSQFVQSGDVPGDLFAVNAIDTFVRFEAAQTAMDVVVVVTYIGLNESGAPFFGAMVGTAAI